MDSHVRNKFQKDAAEEVAAHALSGAKKRKKAVPQAEKYEAASEGQWVEKVVGRKIVKELRTAEGNVYRRFVGHA